MRPLPAVAAYVAMVAAAMFFACKSGPSAHDGEDGSVSPDVMGDGATVFDAADGGSDGDSGASLCGSGTGALDLFASGSGAVDVFVNGSFLGKTNSPGELFSNSCALQAGENIIVLRARNGGATSPFVVGQFEGSFGKAGTSAQWRAKAAVGAEATEAIGSWATQAYDDSTWPNATDVQASPSSSFPQDGPARAIWTASAADATVLLRLKLYVPANWAADKPYGFGRAVTGGAGGNVVTVTTPAELAAAVMGSTPTIIQFSGELDFRGSEGTTTALACNHGNCADGQYQLDDVNTYCAGKPTFNVDYDTAGKTGLKVGSNKTILGIGPNATIRGKGLKIMNGVSNVIVRNLTITDINPRIIFAGDGITVNDADGVWIDHVRFSLIGRMMFVSGVGKATNVTLSWNEFDGRTPYSSQCNGCHYWVMLMVGATNTMTVQNNWIHDTSGRGPHAGGYGSVNTLQFVNDFYDHVPGIAANPSTTYTKLLYEGTYFRNVDTPFEIDTSEAPAPGQAYAPIASTLTQTAAACQAALGRPCTANTATPQNGTFPLDQSVLDAFTGLDSGAVVPAYPAEEVPNVVPHLAGPGHI